MPSSRTSDYVKYENAYYTWQQTQDELAEAEKDPAFVAAKLASYDELNAKTKKMFEPRQTVSADGWTTVRRK